MLYMVYYIWLNSVGWKLLRTGQKGEVVASGIGYTDHMVKPVESQLLGKKQNLGGQDWWDY